MYWSKTSLHSTVILNEGATGSDGITVEIPSLIFKRTEISDSGNYICYAVNEIGKGWSEPISLTGFSLTYYEILIYIYKDIYISLKNTPKSVRFILYIYNIYVY